MGKDDPGRLPELDGLRGIAIGLVLMLHTIGGAAVPLAGRLGRLGWVGVDLFFVLSGFLITRILLESRREPNYFKNFYARRALRILPLYYVVLVLGFTAGEVLEPPFGFAYGWRDALSHVLLFQNWTTRDHFGFWPIQVGWSLAIEEQFYLLWPLVVRTLAPARVHTLLLVVLCASPVARAAALLGGTAPVTVYIMTPFRLDGLAAGALVGLWSAGLTGTAKPLSRTASATLAVGALIALALTADLVLRGDRVLISSERITAGPSLAMAGAFSLAAVGFGAALYWVLHFGRDARLTRVLMLRPLRILGTISYGLYLIHAAVIPIVHRALRPAIEGSVGVHGATLTMVCIVVEYTLFFGLATLSWKFLESPMLSLRSRFPRTAAAMDVALPARPAA